MKALQRVPTQEERAAFVAAARFLRGERDDKVHLNPAEMEMLASWGATFVRFGKQVGVSGYYVEMGLDGERFTTIVGGSSPLLRLTKKSSWRMEVFK